MNADRFVADVLPFLRRAHGTVSPRRETHPLPSEPVRLDGLEAPEAAEQAFAATAGPSKATDPRTLGGAPQVPPLSRPSCASSPWPDELPGLGHRVIEALGSCERCGDSTFAAYGQHRFCLGCAQWLEVPATHYVGVLRRLCGLTVSADLDAIQEALREQGRAAEALGDALASRISATVDAAWYAETGTCPGCGEVGLWHRPGDAA